MDGGLLKFLVPKIPSLANTTLWHSLGMTETSKQWDLRTALTVQVLRSLMSGGEKEPTPVGKIQASTLKDPGVKGKTWVANATIPAPKGDQEGLRDAVFAAIDQLSESNTKPEYTKPNLADTEIEWTGFRPNVGKNDTMPDISEAEKYSRMMAEPTRTSDTTILYFHGGAGVTMSPGDIFMGDCLSRNLSKEVGIDIFSVDYNLAPEAPYPIPFLQGLGAWIYLTRVLRYRPDQIYIGGDSFGSFTTLNLARFLRLEFRGLEGEPTQAKGAEVPKGLILLSPQLIMEHDFPSREKNQGTDIVGLWYADWGRDAQAIGPRFVTTNKLDLSNPWLAPVYLPPTEYAKLPPTFVANGGCEVLLDEGRELVSRARKAGVEVEYYVDPLNVHDYFTLHGELPAAKKTYALIATWLAKVESKPALNTAIPSGGVAPPPPKELEDKPKVHL